MPMNPGRLSRKKKPRSQLNVFPLIGPGFRGLNTELATTVGLVDPFWALVLDNAVFDREGRIASRKGYVSQTTTAASVAVAATCALSDANFAHDDGEQFSSGSMLARLTATGWTEGTDSVTFTTTHWSTTTSGSTPPAFPGGTWATIGSFTSEFAWDGGNTEHPSDGPYVYTGLWSNFDDPFQNNGGGNWVRVEMVLNGPGGDSTACELFVRDSGI